MSMIEAGKLRHWVRLEEPVPDVSLDGAGSGSWALVQELWAEIQDALPSRGERLAAGVNISARPARLRIRYLDGVTSAMRFVEGSRIMQIVSGPAELGNREGLEFMVEDYRPAGNPA